MLPVPDIPKPGLTTFDAKDPDTSYPPIEPLRPPEEAPNVLVILLDDVGFGASSAFGGLINTPVADRLAKNGTVFDRAYCQQAVCAPSRAPSPPRALVGVCVGSIDDGARIGV